MNKNIRRTKQAHSEPTCRPKGHFLKFRTRWRHVLHIDQRIRSGQAPNCSQLAAELEVSRRTVLRDIEFLKVDLGAPVRYDPDRRGYVYTEPNWDMPSVRITEGEIFALLVAEKALEAYAGTPWAERLQRVFERMMASLPDRIEVAPQKLLPRIQFDEHAPSRVSPEILDIVAQAVLSNLVLEMNYRPLGQAQVKHYVLDPYLLRRVRGAWYLIGRDHRSGHVPMFNLSRIERVAATGATFDYDSAQFDPETYFAGTFGVHQASERYHVVIEFSGWAAQLVRERRWHPSQRLTDLPGNRLRFELKIAHLDDIWPWILSWGAEARVLRPAQLARFVQEQAANIVKRYTKHHRGKPLRR